MTCLGRNASLLHRVPSVLSSPLGPSVCSPCCGDPGLPRLRLPYFVHDGESYSVSRMTERVDLRHGDCIALMKAMPECSVDSCITDSSYRLASRIRRSGTN